MLPKVQISVSIFAILFFSSEFLVGCNSSKKITGRYKNDFLFWKYFIQLNKDSTFSFKLDAHLASDSATGIYSINNDTIFFKYNYSSKDSMEAELLGKGLNMSIEDALFINYSNFRSLKAFFKGKHLYYRGSILRKTKSSSW